MDGYIDLEDLSQEDRKKYYRETLIADANGA
jgi:hypothetical protein